jgi:hypothetical protein
LECQVCFFLNFVSEKRGYKFQIPNCWLGQLSW